MILIGANELVESSACQRSEPAKYFGCQVVIVGKVLAR